MTEWKEYKLEEIIEVFIDYRGKTPQKSSFGIPLITAKVVKEGRILPPNEFIPEADYDSWMTRGLPEINDVVLTTEAPLGEVALIKDNRVALAQRIITMRGKRDIVDNIFLKYYFQSKQGQYELSSRASGTTVFGIKAEVLKKVPVFLPPLIEQRRIAAILSSLDDKIDLLHRENATLEQMTETMFRQWFVVDAKEEWKEVALGDVVKTTSGGTPSRKHSDYYENGTINWVKSKELDGTFISTTEELITEDAVANSSAKMLPEKSVLIAMYGATVGEFGILSKPMTCNQAVCALIPNKNYPYTYLYIWTALMKDEFINLASGAAQQNISQDLIKQQLVCSDTEKIMQYDKLVRGYFDKMENNQKQIQTLIQTRDELLPRLMSGEVKI